MTNRYTGPQTDRDGNLCIHLQGLGLHRAKPAADLQVGDVMVWNFAATSVVLTVRHSGKSVYVSEQSENGKIWPERRFLASRLVACKMA